MLQHNNKPKYVLYLYSGKGGVGKSTVCVNLAYAFKNIGMKVGLLDADISGPSIPTMVKNIPSSTMPKLENFTVIPGNFGDVKVSSAGFICEASQDSFWQGKYLRGAFEQLLFSVDWDVDILLIDLPPGTNDIHQTLFSQMPGKVVLITTPQKVAYSDTVKSVDFLHRLNCDIAGFVENMSYYQCDHCDEKTTIFERAEDADLSSLGIKKLGELPIYTIINKCANEGIPYLYKNTGTLAAKQYSLLAKSILENYNLCSKNKSILVEKPFEEVIDSIKTSDDSIKQTIEVKKLDVSFGMLPDEILSSVLAQYNLNTDNCAVLPFVNVNKKAVAINRRSETARKAVIFDGKMVYILKEIPWYCSNKDFVNFEIKLQCQLRNQQLPVPKILSTKSSTVFYNYLFNDKEKFYFLQEFIQGDSWTATDKQNQNAARALANMHNQCVILREIDKDSLYHEKQFHRNVFDIADMMLDGTKQVTDQNKTNLAHQYLEMFDRFYQYCQEKIKECRSHAYENGYGDIQHPIHGDYNPWNMLFDKTSSEVNAILDFDNSAIDNPMHDIAEFVLNFCFFKYRDQMTRFVDIPPNIFDSSRAEKIILEYGKERKNFVMKQHLTYFRDSMVAVTIEFYALGLRRGDFNMDQLDALIDSIKLIDKESHKFASKLASELITECVGLNRNIIFSEQKGSGLVTSDESQQTKNLQFMN